MRKFHFPQLFAAALILSLLALPVRGTESEYCFSPGDFEEGITGICIESLPKEGALLLGQRLLRPGDVLTADQAGRMICTAAPTEYDRELEMKYLPIFSSRVDGRQTVGFRIRGRQDHPPVAEDSAAETYKNIPNTGFLRVKDPEGQTLQFTVTRKPRRGTVEISGTGSFTYTPKKNKVGIDSFAYTASDPAGNVSREATVTVTILKPSEAAVYIDTAGQSCSFAAEWMKNTGIFTGEALGGQLCFHPQQQVSRGEFLAMLLRTLEISPEQELTASVSGEGIPLWLQPYVAAAVRSGLTAGLPQPEFFSEDAPISEGEAAVMIRNALDLPVLAPDEGAPAEQVLSAGSIRVEPEAILTRARASQLLYQVFTAA